LLLGRLLLVSLVFWIFGFHRHVFHRHVIHMAWFISWKLIVARHFENYKNTRSSNPDWLKSKNLLQPFALGAGIFHGFVCHQHEQSYHSSGKVRCHLSHSRRKLHWQGKQCEPRQMKDWLLY
jgi:hypothetical protein